MFSVEDLLISHGYKLSKNPTSLTENRCDGYQHEIADRKSAHETLNGFPANPGACIGSKKTAVKSYLNDNESSHAIEGRQLGPSYRKDIQAVANTHASERGFYDRPQLTWSSRPKTEKDLAYWRRRGQDFSILLGYTDREDSEMKGTAAPCDLYGYDKEGQWEVGGGTGNVKRTGMQESWKPPGDYRWQSLRTEHWSQPNTFGGLVSDGDRGRLLQDMHTIRQGDTTVASHVKRKSQSLPRVLAPESLRCIEMPSLVSNKLSLSGTQAASFPQMGWATETPKHSDPAAHFLPLPKPKYGRPLKPPSYELHRQTRGMLETNLLQGDQRKEEAISYLTKVSEQSRDACVLDSGLEPPLYIPPPCYKSPAQQSVDQHLTSEVPEYDMCFNNGVQSPGERAILAYQASASTFGTEHCNDEQFPHDKKSHARHLEGCLSSVQYIPFDDPRIRHFKMAQLDGLQENGRVTRDANKTSPNAFQESALELQYNSAFLSMSDSLNTDMKCDQVPGSSAHSGRWLAESSVDKNNYALPIQKESYDADNDLNYKHPKGRLSAQSPHTEPPCETMTKVKMFEPGTEIQSKRSSKKRTNETIFCLVSIPVKSELNLPDTDKNNNLTHGADEKNGFDNSGVLQEQSLLSTSSTDLELQALTGNMTNKNELQKQELWRPQFRQMNDLRSLQPAKHKELQYSGSWPGDQYKDQQTQTSFTEESKILRLVHSAEPSGPNKVTTSQLLREAISTTEPTQTVLPAEDQKCGKDASSGKGQGHLLDKSRSSASSRTAVLIPKACQNLPCTSCTDLSGQEKETSSFLREEEHSPGSTKELFGQFLLKPVGRRPWDVISELESFNKELQEQEASSEDGVENEEKQERENGREEERESETCLTEGPSQGHCRPRMQSETVKLAVPIFKQGRERSKSEHASVSESSGTRVLSSDFYICARAQSCLQAKEMGESVRPANGYVFAEPRKQKAGTRVIKQAVSPDTVKEVLPGSYDDHYNPFNSILFREENQVKNHRDNVAEFDRLKMNTAPRNNLALDRGSAVRLSLVNRNQGVSEPDLRSVGLDDGQGLGALELDCYGKPIIAEIPPNESLQARAARILGIDVAVESLMPNNTVLPDEHPLPNVSQSLELPTERALGSKMETKVTSYEERRKCGWTESSLFVGDRNVSVEPVENQNSGQETWLAEQRLEHHKNVSRQVENQITPLESVVVPFSERNLVLPSVEKRARSTSKVIETLQGKLASPPSRAAMDRLVRMKEVDSVSRMRRLSIKTTDSTEDRDEDKHSKGPEERENEFSFSISELPRKLSHGSSVSKRIISLAEKGLSDNMSEKKTGRDLFCLDSYDPTRVERV